MESLTIYHLNILLITGHVEINKIVRPTGTYVRSTEVSIIVQYLELTILQSKSFDFNVSVMWLVQL